MLMMLRAALLLVLVGSIQDAREFAKSGMEKYLKRDFAGAIEDFSRAIEMDPKEWRVYGLRAKARKDVGDLDGAILDYTRVMDLNPSLAVAYAGRASARQLKRDLDGAIEDYTEALRRAPKDADLYVKRAAVKLESSDRSGAITDCKKALEINPKDTVALMNLSSASLEKKDFEAALSSSTKAIEIDPRDPSGYDLRGAVEYGKGDYALALKDVDRAIQLGAEGPDCLYLRACCLLARSNGKEARAAFELALKAADAGWFCRRRAESLLSVLAELTAGPSTVPFRRRMFEKGHELLQKGETDKAIEVLEEAVRLDGKSPEVYDALVEAYLKRNDEDKRDRARVKVLVWDVIDLGKGLSPKMQRYLNTVTSQVLSSIRWLAHHQMADGRWSSESVVEVCRKDGTPRCEGKGKAGSDLRATSLAILAFLGSGHSHLSTENYDTKPVGETVKKALQWMIAQQKADGSFGDPSSEHFLEDHAISTLAMSEAYGSTASYELNKIPAEQFLRGPAQKAVDFLVAHRVPDKGWPAKAKKDNPDPIASGWALFALKSAMLSELKVPADAVRQGLEWMIGTTLKARPASRDMAGIFGVAVASFLGNKPDGELLLEVLSPISEALASQEAEGRDALFAYVSAVALRLGDNAVLWQSWRDRTKTTLVRGARFDDEGNACPAGSWDALGPIDGSRGRVITTALNIMTLEIIYRYANVFCLPPAEFDSARTIESNPRYAAAYYDRGNAKKDHGDLDGAIAEYTRAIQSDPKYAAAYANRGAAKWAKGDLDGSIADSTRAIEIDPRNAMAYYNRGGAKQAKGDLDGSIADCTRAIEIDPKYAAAYANRGNAKLAKGDLDGSIADYSRAIKIDPKYAVAYYNRGNVKRDKGDLDGSIADYTRSIEIDPKYAPAYFKRGNVKQGKGDVDNAIADYTRAIEINPNYAAAYFNRGNVHYNRGSWKDALADYRRSFEFDYDYSRLCVWLSRSRLNERDEATRELAQYFAARKTGQPDDWPSKIARLFTGDLSEADFLKAAGSKDPKTDREQKCEAYFYAGSRRLLDGDKIGAKDLFQKCLDTRVMDFNEYTSAAAELKRLGK
jgi:tetratricopeptide (TPR) repeat protein